MAGVGVPQLTAIMMCAAAARAADVPIIGDGGIRYSGDIVKALAAGADSVMLGRLLAVAEESPGEAERVGGRVVKEYRGMGSLGAMSAGSDRYPQVDRHKLVPEGVEARVSVAGPLAGILYQLIGGMQRGHDLLRRRVDRRPARQGALRPADPLGPDREPPARHRAGPLRAELPVGGFRRSKARAAGAARACRARTGFGLVAAVNRDAGSRV